MLSRQKLQLRRQVPRTSAGSFTFLASPVSKALKAMKIDQDYLKRLLEACQASEKPTFDIQDLKAAGLDYLDKQFEFHMMILHDQGFVEQDGGYPGIGLIKSADGFASWSVLPLRLTASGHQFVEALSNKRGLGHDQA